MDPQPHTVKAEALAPGMTLHGVTGFSAEYAYLDSTLIAFLRERFPGAACDVQRKGARLHVAVEELQGLDALHGLTAAAPVPLDAAAIASLRSRGLREFRVTGQAAAAGAAAATPAADARAPERAPAAAAGTQAARRQRLAQARAFVEQVGQAAERREQASQSVQDLFSQGRAGKYSTKPAEEAVEEIISQGLSRAMGAVAGLRGSDQTYAHCVDTAVIFQEAYGDILRHQGKPVTEVIARQTLLAGFCHDIGKSKVPREILDSTKRFAPDGEEMRLMRSHAAHGAQILSDLGMNKAIINVAHYHHVKVDTGLPASYPEARWEDVLPITRLAAVVDVYQALIGKRSYKKNWVPGKAADYLKGLRGKEFDPQMLDYFLRVVGLYPIGSLVRLSSGELAFVVAIGGDVLDRPVVAVVENAKGELLRQHTLMDLMDTPDLSIEEVVDHYEHYNADPEQAFRIFSSLNVA
jgi:putative nucleotidyltransferase with HDIG domain